MASSNSLFKTVAGLALCAWLPIAHAATVFTLTSPDFTDNGVLAQKFGGNIKTNAACIGDNFSPAFSWDNIPSGTKSFALLIKDVDANGGLGVNHLVTYGIPADVKGFAPNALTEGKGFVGGKNTMGNGHYNGPCPPLGKGDHHYVVQLIATDLAPNALPKGYDRELLLDKLKGHTTGATSIIARFGK